MPKCPKCGSELQSVGDSLQCPNCGSKFKTQKKPQQQVGEDINDVSQIYEEITDKDKIRDLEARLAELEAEKKAREKQEKKQLEERIAALEAEKYKREHRFDKIKAIGSSKAVVFAKTHWISLLISVLLLVAFITLMVTLVGLRGIYVNVNDSDDYIDFTATSYRTNVVDQLTGKTRIEEGKWKIDGDRLILTVKDELFGTIDADFDFQQIDGYKRISIDGKEYKRVSLVGIKTTQHKVKITFDPQNGQKPIVYKVKIGNKFNQDPPEVEQDERFPLLGWSDAQDGNGMEYVSGRRFWEDVTYYAQWNDFVIEDGVLVAVNKARIKGDVTIPSNVTSIGEEAFKGCTGITSVTIPDSVESIGGSAFEDCTGLQTVTIGKGVTKIGDDAFYGCTGITKVNVTSLKSWCEIEFESNPLYAANYSQAGSAKLYVNDVEVKDDVNIPTGTAKIGDYAFYGLTGITSVTIPDSVESIGYEAFRDCTGLQTVTIGKGVQSIGVYAFYGCTGLQTVTIGDGVTSIGYEAFSGCAGLSEITIPDSVTSIGEYAFSGCRGLQTVTIGEGVTSIGNYAFNYCTGITKVNVTSLKSWCEIEFESYSSNPLYAAVSAKLYLNDVEVKDDVNIPTGTNKIGECAFRGLTGITSVTIPDSVESIGGHAFEDCTGLQTVTIGEGVESIGSSAFSSCTGLQTVTIGEGVQSIGGYAFYGCTGLQTVTIGEGVQSIGGYAFYGCTGLKDIYYAGSETQWANLEKGERWNQYYSNGEYKNINYQLHYNSTGPSAASAEIAEENASGSAAFEEVRTPVVWVKKQRLCA